MKYTKEYDPSYVITSTQGSWLFFIVCLEKKINLNSLKSALT